MAKKKQVATYVSENQGESHERPALKRLIAEAAKKSREFDTVKIDNISVLGTPDEAQNAIARFRELGIEVIAMVGGTGPYGWEGPPSRTMKWLAEHPCHAQNRHEKEDRKEFSALLKMDDVVRMVIAPMAVVEIFKTRHPIPWETRRDLRWPSEDNLYIEFANAIVMDPLEDGDLDKVMHGIIVARGENPRKVMTIMTIGGCMTLVRSWVDLEHGTAAWGDPMRGRHPEEDENGKAVGSALAGLAALIGRPDTKITKIPAAGDENKTSAWLLIEPK
jgi:hypothetical protein